MRVRRKVSIPMRWEGVCIDEEFKIDLFVEDKVKVALKSVERTLPIHAKQLLTYLRLADKRLGLLVNFGEVLIKEGIKKVANGL